MHISDVHLHPKERVVFSVQSVGGLGVEDCEGQHVTSPQCVLSVEHGVIWPLDSSTTSMKAGVNSGDACHANRL